MSGASEITREQMEALYQLSDEIDRLFAALDPKQPLGRCMLTFSRPGGNTRAVGFYKPDGWTDENGTVRVAEIAINPEAMALLGFTEVIQTIVHEKCHQWQHEHGTPSRAGYHNKQWAAKMESIGLVPSSTGKPGGKKTGQRMADYIATGGPLDKFVQRLPKRLKLPWMGLPSERKKSKPAGYVRYECPGCECLARAKAGLNLRCMDCDLQLEADEADQGDEQQIHS